jgi:hypothetical protein
MGGRAGDVEGKDSCSQGVCYSLREKETKRSMEIETEEVVHLFLLLTLVIVNGNAQSEYSKHCSLYTLAICCTFNCYCC